MAEPYNALGSLKASTGKPREAEQFYKQALEKNPAMLAARHNLALLLAAQKQRLPEALDLWRENLKRAPDYLPSRLSLAGDLPVPKEAIAELISGSLRRGASETRPPFRLLGNRRCPHRNNVLRY